MSNPGLDARCNVLIPLEDALRDFGGLVFFLATWRVEKRARPHGKHDNSLLSISSHLLTFIASLSFLLAAAAIINMASLHLNNKEIADVELTDAPGTSSPNVFDDGISHVPKKYRGTSVDKRDMTVMGKKQVLRVGIPSEIAAVQVLIVFSETSVSSPCSASHLHV